MRKTGRITSVCYRGNVGVGPFQHVHVEVEKQVLPTETPTAALAQAREFVEERLLDFQEGTFRANDNVREPTVAKLSAIQRARLKDAFAEALYGGVPGARNLAERRWERFVTCLENRRLL